ncbi:geranylgeranyl diphosphate synthase [Acidianus sp. RZ1]|uniref:geranylgeranyl diphosphate synthase n=1 Tax=Acidianus sp. RZ1 TaxID=1540082 RepID=UPI001490EDD9|nr:geranylgeranyl diphosphate synthase [Acidianus sp. RZ1]NON62238.1 polyprenyl synthetase family protein [Acidianus sp. RZ1]
MELQEYFNEIVRNVDMEIQNRLKGDVKGLYEASYHLFTAGGKRLRPLVVVSVANVLGGDINRAYLAATAVEILHNFTLIHDDIMDQDTIRRGVPTVHVKWGVPMAILAGDLLHAKAFEVLGDALKGLENDRIFLGFSEFAKSTEIIAEGQTMDMEFENRDDVTEVEYMKMIEKKTAQLFSCSAFLGALISKANDYFLDKAKVLGMKMGTAFQIVDDILGLTAEEKDLGKPVYSDIRESKKTILLIRALNEASESEKKTIMEGLGSKDPEKIRKAAEIVKNLSLDYAYSLAEKLAEEANRIIEEWDSNTSIGGKALKYLVELTVKRRK